MLYATVAEFKQLGLTASGLATVRDEDLAKALSAASARAASYVGQRFRLPLLAWGDDLRDAVCALTAWRVLGRRGFNPESGTDMAIRTSYEDALAWLRAVAEGSAQPDGLVDDGFAVVITEPLRGW